MKRLHTLALFYLRWLRKFSGLALRGEDLVAILVIIGDESKAPVPKAWVARNGDFVGDR